MPTDEDGDVIMTDAAATAEAEAGAPPEEPEEPAAAPEEPAAAEAPPVEEGPPPEERTARAEAAKEEGNALLKAGDAKAAVAKYGEGITLAEPLLEKDPGELGEELQLRATTAYTALRLNSAQACLKCCEWLAAIEHADKVLLLDKDNTKALYRRGCASAQLNTESRLEQARADFARVATLDPANREVRGQLAKAKDLLKDLRQAEKQRLSAVMSGGLYQKEHAKLEGRQAAYQEEVQRRKDAGEDEISFEDWQKKEKEKEEEAKKKAREEAEAERKRQREEERQRREEELRREQEELERKKEEERKIREAEQKKQQEAAAAKLLQSVSASVQEEIRSSSADAALKAASGGASHLFSAGDEQPRKHKPLTRLDGPSSGGGETKLREDEMRRMIQQVPTDKAKAFAFAIDWDSVESHNIVEKKLRPWVKKKVTEYLGSEEQGMIEFIMRKVSSRTAPENILAELEGFLDEEAENFTLKMWRMLIFEVLRVRAR
mmetsp:Transcript_103895/g.268944  ORF Transcript_103895/g.268944 Transcript_103895/m.268944 type:complete len:492 (-) Transcript_103895:220-1695(-)